MGVGGVRYGNSAPSKLEDAEGESQDRDHEVQMVQDARFILYQEDAQQNQRKT